LGQTLNPSIQKTKTEDIEFIKELISKEDIFLSSPSKRAVETAKLLSTEIIIDPLLNEIDYGDVEGKDISYLKKNFQNIKQDWEQGKDPKFPNGENSLDVKTRMFAFLESLLHKNIKTNCFVFSHNVAIKCLLGEFYKIPKDKWHKINIPHLEPLEIIKTKDNHLYINLSKPQMKKIFKAFIHE